MVVRRYSRPPVHHEIRTLSARSTHQGRSPTLAVTIGRTLRDQLGWGKGDTLLLQVTTTKKLLITRLLKETNDGEDQ